MTGQLPLSNQNVLLTRPSHQCGKLKRLCEDAGATIFLQPTIEILPPSDWHAVDEAINSIFDYDILIFASSNGVRSFFERAKAIFPTILKKRTPLFPRIVATGPGTSEALAEYRITEVLLPSESYDAEGIIAIMSQNPVVGKRVLLVRGNRGRTLLSDELSRLGAIVKQVSVYQSVDLTVPAQEIAYLMQCGKIHWATVTSSAIGRSLVKMFGEDLRRTKLAGISPITSQALTECGFPPTVEATEATLPALVDAIVFYRSTDDADAHR
ncbi:MAG: uroporphyrinogen-III synthase [Planctomycetaceae bacterium]|nr:uroporphyrinogen-III synthase [Planctomycetaceae bacterium]